MTAAWQAAGAAIRISRRSALSVGLHRITTAHSASLQLALTSSLHQLPKRRPGHQPQQHPVLVRAPAFPPTAVRSPGVSHSAERQSCGRPESVLGARNVLLRQWTPSRTACSAPSNATCTFISPLHNGLSARLVAAAAHPEAIAAAAAGPATAEKSASLSQSSRQTLLHRLPPDVAAETRCSTTGRLTTMVITTQRICHKIVRSPVSCYRCGAACGSSSGQSALSFSAAGYDQRRQSEQQQCDRPLCRTVRSPTVHSATGVLPFCCVLAIAVLCCPPAVPSCQ